MMKLLKILLITIFIVALVVPTLGCGAESDEAEPETQLVTVQRGDLTVEITAAGNLALSRTEDLAIDLFYQEGTIEEVLVAEGDTVEEGQVLVKLDTAEWNDELSILAKALTTAQRNLTAKERAVIKAQDNVDAKERAVVKAELVVTGKETDVSRAERQVDAKVLAVTQAQLDLQTAEVNLSDIDDVKEVQDDIDAAQFAYDVAVRMLTGKLGGAGELDSFTYWTQLKAQAKAELDSLEDDMAEILAGTSVSVSSDVALDVAKKHLAVEQKRVAVGDAELAVEDARQAVIDAQMDVEDAIQAVIDAQVAVEDARLDVEDAGLDAEDAKQDVEDAQSDLDEAESLSSVITAPFAGFVTNVNVEGGDDILRGTVAVQIADPNKFEAEIVVSEMDISQVKLGGDALVKVDAIGLSLPATVTHIAPTATIQSGVVNYSVTVEVQSLEDVQQQRQEARQKAIQGIQQGELPEPLKQAIAAGQITQQQAEEMMKQRQQAQDTPQTQMPTMIPENFQLREGLTVTVSITVEGRNDVLLVPNAAITSRQGQSYVQVQLTDGTTEERLIQTGISDWQFTEVTEGLSEGEEVVVPQGTATTSAPQQGQGGMFIPGMGRPR